MQRGDDPGGSDPDPARCRSGSRSVNRARPSAIESMIVPTSPSRSSTLEQPVGARLRVAPLAIVEHEVQELGQRHVVRTSQFGAVVTDVEEVRRRPLVRPHRKPRRADDPRVLAVPARSGTSGSWSLSTRPSMMTGSLRLITASRSMSFAETRRISVLDPADRANAHLGQEPMRRPDRNEQRHQAAECHGGHYRHQCSWRSCRHLRGPSWESK